MLDQPITKLPAPVPKTEITALLQNLENTANIKIAQLAPLVFLKPGGEAKSRSGYVTSIDERNQKEKEERENEIYDIKVKTVSNYVKDLALEKLECLIVSVDCYSFFQTENSLIYYDILKDILSQRRGEIAKKSFQEEVAKYLQETLSDTFNLEGFLEKITQSKNYKVLSSLDLDDEELQEIFETEIKKLPNYDQPDFAIRKAIKNKNIEKDFMGKREQQRIARCLKGNYRKRALEKNYLEAINLIREKLNLTPLETTKERRSNNKTVKAPVAIREDSLTASFQNIIIDYTKNGGKLDAPSENDLNNFKKILLDEAEEILECLECLERNGSKDIKCFRQIKLQAEAVINSAKNSAPVSTASVAATPDNLLDDKHKKKIFELKSIAFNYKKYINLCFEGLKKNPGAFEDNINEPLFKMLLLRESRKGKKGFLNNELYRAMDVFDLTPDLLTTQNFKRLLQLFFLAKHSQDVIITKTLTDKYSGRHKRVTQESFDSVCHKILKDLQGEQTKFITLQDLDSHFKIASDKFVAKENREAKAKATLLFLQEYILDKKHRIAAKKYLGLFGGVEIQVEGEVRDFPTHVSKMLDAMELAVKSENEHPFNTVRENNYETCLDTIIDIYIDAQSSLFSFLSGRSDEVDKFYQVSSMVNLLKFDVTNSTAKISEFINGNEINCISYPGVDEAKEIINKILNGAGNGDQNLLKVLSWLKHESTINSEVNVLYSAIKKRIELTAAPYSPMPEFISKIEGIQASYGRI